MDITSVEFRGCKIEVAQLPDGTWQANVDGRDVGQPQRSRTHGIERAQSFINRSLGKPKVVRRELADDAAYWDGLRDMIRTA